MKPEFYVIKLGRLQDPNRAAIGVGAEAAPAQAAPRAAPRAGARFELQAAIDEPPVQFEAYGYEIMRSELRDPVIRFTTAEAAEKYAQELAEKYPKTLYATMGVLKIFESAKAPLIEKRFNEQGELVIVGEN